jgi:hypothetical protein
VLARPPLARTQNQPPCADHGRSFPIVDGIMLLVPTAEPCEIAADVAEATGARSLDALHLGALSRAGKGTLSLLTFDVRLAQAGRALGVTVLGA